MAGTFLGKLLFIFASCELLKLSNTDFFTYKYLISLHCDKEYLLSGWISQKQALDIFWNLGYWDFFKKIDDDAVISSEHGEESAVAYFTKNILVVGCTAFTRNYEYKQEIWDHSKCCYQRNKNICLSCPALSDVSYIYYTAPFLQILVPIH